MRQCGDWLGGRREQKKTKTRALGDKGGAPGDCGLTRRHIGGGRQYEEGFFVRRGGLRMTTGRAPTLHILDVLDILDTLDILHMGFSLTRSADAEIGSED